MYSYVEHLGTLPCVADKALGMRRKADLYLVRRNISHHLKFSFPAQVTKETEFLMFCLQMHILYLEAESSMQGSIEEGWVERDRIEGQKLWPQELIERLGSGFSISPRGNKTILFPLSGIGICAFLHFEVGRTEPGLCWKQISMDKAPATYPWLPIT